MELPEDVVRAVGSDVVWSHDHEGLSGEVWRAGSCWVKRSGADEHDRLRWLGEHFEVPRIRAFTDGWLVLADVGAPSLASVDPVLAATVMGTVLRSLHSLPVDSCPYDARVPALLDHARRNVEAGLVDPEDFDDDNLGATPGELLARLIATAPRDEDLVVAHGDFCPPNVLLRPDGSTVLIDVSRLGVSDRHRDIALAHRELGGEAAAAFDRAYGLTPDPPALEWYRLLDEFF
ncbi:kanamycin kinase/aminoglycoside 3'-phosphotransferase-2 [Lentzea xinjiangensis]|uniref:Kanamycin kinase/aminoglycoside 3'-phosphotransferase-2 n=1 Tax=Lentzea xinjiangensis TaxID=402600 RepID=A0A1H9RFF5_9PSEU|nr:aminoglycoside 3'-phosphotransferase [Lentzea xinjiangensis]SER71394.1 kanamycin kinase/aminoglycoside 3'-phosphotransferase-2 [Lentzea xinjiangensis]